MENENKISFEEFLNTIEEFTEEEKFLLEVKRIERQFIRNLAQTRKNQGLTQKQLADMTGMSQQLISDIEKSGRKPTLPNIIKYLLGLNINLNELFSN